MIAHKLCLVFIIQIVRSSCLNNGFFSPSEETLSSRERGNNKARGVVRTRDFSRRVEQCENRRNEFLKLVLGLQPEAQLEHALHEHDHLRQ